MRVRDIMTKDPICCRPDTNLAAAAELMWNNDCGVLPVVEDGKLSGVITDRDICIATGTNKRPAADIAVEEAATPEVQVCAPDDDLHVAMAIMRRAKVRRLPVVNDGGRVEGILALNDIVLSAQQPQWPIRYEEVMDTLKAVSEHRSPRVAPKIWPPIPVAVA